MSAPDQPPVPDGPPPMQVQGQEQAQGQKQAQPPAQAGPEAAPAPETAPDDPLAALLSGYAPFEGVPDELMDETGTVRPVWRDFLNRLAGLDAEELDLACARGSQYLRDAGVFFRHYGPDSHEERDWPLSHLPLLIDAAEWQQIAAGLVERADLLEQVMADLYGSGQLVADGLLPPELLAGNPEWLRPMVGVAPRSGHYLHMLAFDIGRGPEGQWWVLGDRAQAPSGAGFALETRMATARSFPALMADSNVARLAGFFRGFRDALLALRAEEDSRVAILTPGPMNDTYFEHAYIARYLGFLLVQGEDLVVRDGRLMVHTVGGLRPISVLWRRLDAEWLDPLELREDSQIGTAGLLSALRSGGLTMVNAPGSGVLETRALMAFIPAIARHLLGRDLALPNIATWWCGSAEAQDYVRENAGRMTIDRALSTSLPFDHSPEVVIAGKRPDGSDYDPGMLSREGGRLAAQQIVSLSTAPALSEGRLVARPASLRVVLTRTAQGWQVMPGGFARIGQSGTSADVSMQRGGSVCDVWVVGGPQAPDDTLLAATTGERMSLPQLAALPTRAADNLFWLGRYSDRVEQKIRLQRAYHLRLAEYGRADMPLVEMLAEYLASMGVEAARPLPEGLTADLDAAMGSAGRIRDRFSTDGWNALTDLKRTADNLAPRLKPGDDAARALSVLLRKISGFSGLVHENMYHATGWRFLSLGRAIERAWATSGMLATFADPAAPLGAYEIAIETGDAVMTHRMRFSATFTRETVLDLLLLDENYPRSVLAQLDDILTHLDWLEKLTHDLSRKPTPIRRAVMKLQTELATARPEEISPERLSQIAATCADLSGLLAETYLR
ncbi:circularly permuted type 2 ATP-grasp protein [Oceanicola sp. S124]|uniref:circularly permuted type 2 ATP-grasp protein n=1 Tax=Oceanicola sp. S124 TaxID=1042378 RepID=UPI0002558984|nr:circularly permuted type 2 ATP-grasp protein [Oceanicola sp. S124]